MFMGYFLTFVGGVLAAAAVVLAWRIARKGFSGRFARELQAHAILRERDDKSPVPTAADELAVIVSDLAAELKDAADDGVGRLQAASRDLERLLEKAEYQRAYLERLVNDARRLGFSEHHWEGRAKGRVERFEGFPGQKELAREEKPSTETVATARAERERILSLAADGLTVGEIAERTGIGKGEVGLVINMAKRRNPQSAG